jgi:methylated-DNA-[protein]-cysteine S-methyltransferase
MTGLSIRKPGADPGATGSRRDIGAFPTRVRTPFAVLGIRTDGRAVTHVAYLPLSADEAPPADPVAERAVRELRRYLVDPSFRFTVPLAPAGTLFQRRVWGAIAEIPAGQSRTYGELARKLVTAPRAIGQACGANRIALIIPCHRVVGALGSLGGFMGDADGDAGTSDLFAWDGDGGESRVFPATIKRWLLAHEGHRFGR